MIKLSILVGITNIIILIYYNVCALLAWYKEMQPTYMKIYFTY